MTIVTKQVKYLFAGLIIVLVALTIVAGCTTETISPVYNNLKPEILSITTSPGDSVEVQDTLSIVCDAEDPEGQELEYKWSAAAGKILGDSTNSTRWAAPRTPGTYFVILTVSDPYSDTTASVEVIVLPRGATNQPPRIALLTMDPDTVTPGDAINCAVQANDPEGDPLSYIWTAETGFFNPESGPQVRWFAPQDLGEHYLKVTVIDSHHFTTDSLAVMVVADTVVEYASDFSTNQVTGSWGTIGLLGGLGEMEGTSQVAWDSTNQAMAVTSRTNYGTYGFRLIGHNFTTGSFSCVARVPNGEYHRIAFAPKLIDRLNYLLFGIDPYVGSWQVLRCTAGSMQYLAEGWKTFDLNVPIRFSYTEYDNRATVSINGEPMWSGVVTAAFQRSAPMGVALYGNPASQPALYDDFRVTNP